VHECGPLGIISLLPYVPGIIGLLWAGRVLERRERNLESSKTEHA
jgi:hypothetical protein